MPTQVRPIPEGYHAITPYLCTQGAAEAIEFYKKAFGAKEIMRFGGPDGKVGHAEMKIGDSLIMLADEYPDIGFRSPQSIGGSPVHVHLYVENSDAVFKQALAVGGKELKPIEDKFYGDRTGTLEDPFGHIWHVATHKEDVAPDEMKKRIAAQCG